MERSDWKRIFLALIATIVITFIAMFNYDLLANEFFIVALGVGLIFGLIDYYWIDE